MRYTEARLTRYAQSLLVGARAGHRRLGAELRRHARGAGAAAGAAAERAAERRHRHRGRHGDRHPAAQPARGRRPPACSCSTSPTATLGDLMQAHQGPGLPDRRPRSSRRASEIRQIYKTGNGSHPRARACTRSRTARSSSPQLPYQVSGSEGAGADRGADAGEEAADGRGPARRVRPREPDAPGDRAALEPRRHRAADGAPVRHHRPRAHATAST